MTRDCAAAMACSLVLAGCIVYPVNRTYYEPNPTDGTPIRSVSCAWHRTANDGLERHIDGTNTTLSVFPAYKEAEPLRINVMIRGSSGVQLEGDKAELHAGSGTSLLPEKVDVRDAGPYFYKTIIFTFPKSASADDDIALVLLPGFLTVHGVQ